MNLKTEAANEIGTVRRRGAALEQAILENILKRGVERGEIDPARLTPRIVTGDRPGAPRGHHAARPDSGRRHR